MCVVLQVASQHLRTRIANVVLRQTDDTESSVRLMAGCDCPPSLFPLSLQVNSLWIVSKHSQQPLLPTLTKPLPLAHIHKPHLPQLRKALFLRTHPVARSG